VLFLFARRVRGPFDASVAAFRPPTAARHKKNTRSSVADRQALVLFMPKLCGGRATIFAQLREMPRHRARLATRWSSVTCRGDFIKNTEQTTRRLAGNGRAVFRLRISFIVPGSSTGTAGNGPIDAERDYPSSKKRIVHERTRLHSVGGLERILSFVITKKMVLGQRLSCDVFFQGSRLVRAGATSFAIGGGTTVLFSAFSALPTGTPFAVHVVESDSVRGSESSFHSRHGRDWTLQLPAREASRVVSLKRT